MSDFLSTPPQVLAALIAAIAALVVAGLQLATNRRQARSLEQMRFQLSQRKDMEAEYLKRYLESVIDGRTQEITSYRKILQAVQSLRDYTRQVRARPGSFVTKRLQDEIQALGATVSTALGEAQIYLPPEDFTIAHRLKNACLNLADQLITWHHSHENAILEEDAPEHSLGTAEQDVKQLQSELRARAIRAVRSLTDSLRIAP
ncbi:MAG TPA: hypothetical protein VHG93_12065 [Longimicrobium sp.]|nr:hypothetical protein [Longimicrobium sp.]